MAKRKEELQPSRSPEQLIKEWLASRQIELVLLDLDDTVIRTVEVFFKGIDEFLAFFHAQFPWLDEEAVRKQFLSLNIEAYGSHSVNPKRWEKVVQRLEENFEVRLPNCPGILMGIYRELPDFEEGALDTLELLKKTGVKMGLVTHANKEWTDFKIDALGLRDFFGNIVIIDEDKPSKTAEDWFSAANSFGVEPAHTLVIGDNVNGDIVAAREAGVKHLFWIDKESGWDLYRRGELPEGVGAIRNLGELVTLINS